MVLRASFLSRCSDKREAPALGSRVVAGVPPSLSPWKVLLALGPLLFLVREQALAGKVLELCSSLLQASPPSLPPPFSWAHSHHRAGRRKSHLLIPW